MATSKSNLYGHYHAKRFFDQIKSKDVALFAAVGNTVPWNVTDTTPVEPWSMKFEESVRSSMAVAKKINPNEVYLIVTKRPYVSGQVYDEWDDSIDMSTLRNFVVVEDTSIYSIYKCLKSAKVFGQLGAMTVAPSTITPTSNDDEPFETSDGYVWQRIHFGSPLDIKVTPEDGVLVVPEGIINGKKRRQVFSLVPDSTPFTEISISGVKYTGTVSTIVGAGDTPPASGFYFERAGNYKKHPLNDFSLSVVFVDGYISGIDFGFNDAKYQESCSELTFTLKDAYTGLAVGGVRLVAKYGPTNGHGSNPSSEVFASGVAVFSEIESDEVSLICRRASILSFDTTKIQTVVGSAIQTKIVAPEAFYSDIEVYSTVGSTVTTVSEVAAALDVDDMTSYYGYDLFEISGVTVDPGSTTIETMLKIDSMEFPIRVIPISYSGGILVAGVQLMVDRETFKNLTGSYRIAGAGTRRIVIGGDRTFSIQVPVVNDRKLNINVWGGEILTSSSFEPKTISNGQKLLVKLALKF